MDFSFVLEKVTNVTAGLIVAIAMHVPFLMHALLSTPPETPLTAIQKQVKNQDSSTDTLDSNTASTSIKSAPSFPPPIPSLASTTLIHVSIPAQTAITGTANAPGIAPSHSGGKVDIVASEQESGTGLYGDAFLNGKQIAKGVPVYSSLEGTSPAGTYYAYRSFSHASAVSEFIEIQIFNLLTGEHTTISNVPGETASQFVPDSRAADWYYVMPYFESYAWQDDHSINFIFYYLAWNAPLERVSPREVWNYDLLSKQYRLISSEN